MGRLQYKLVCGVGIKDVDYVIAKNDVILEDGKKKSKQIWICPYYVKWHKMLVRCYNARVQENRSTYRGCTVCEDWKYLSKFIEWVDSQPDRGWKYKELDKDLLLEGNKYYSPETCVFLCSKVNTFINKQEGNRGKFMIGVQDSYSKNNPFRADCEDPLKRNSSYLGHHCTEMEAHLAWKNKKNEYAHELAELEQDERVKQVLSNKYK